MKSNVPQNDSANEAPYSKVFANPKSASFTIPNLYRIKNVYIDYYFFYNLCLLFLFLSFIIKS